MILFTFNNIENIENEYVAKNRKVFSILTQKDKEWFGFTIGFFNQYFLRREKKWHYVCSGDKAFSINLKNWKIIGQDHGWYDGPHCTYHFGPFFITWDNNNCKKCLE